MLPRFNGSGCIIRIRNGAAGEKTCDDLITSFDLIDLQLTGLRLIQGTG